MLHYYGDMWTKNNTLLARHVLDAYITIEHLNLSSSNEGVPLVLLSDPRPFRELREQRFNVERALRDYWQVVFC